MTKTAIIVGSTGLVGLHLLKLLLINDTYTKVVSLVRQKTKLSHPKLVEHIIDFDNPESYQQLVEGDDLFCCLGTTIKKAGSQEAFEKVDLHYPIEIAQAAVKKGVKQYLLISALGANTQSGNFYMRTKGKCEEALRQQPLKSTSIIRPSLLLGNRKEFRFGEKLGEYIMRATRFLLIGKLRKYRPIEAKKVAYAMLQIALQNKVGYHVYTSESLKELN